MREWLGRAGDDLAAADAVLAMPSPPAWIAAFHAQQCVEKSIKAWLVWRQVEYPFTHDLLELLGSCDEGLRKDGRLTAATYLTEFAVAIRYPGSDPTLPEGRKAVEAARSALAAVTGYLVKEGADVGA